MSRENACQFCFEEFPSFVALTEHECKVIPPPVDRRNEPRSYGLINDKSIPMSLDRACALKAEMKTHPLLFAVNNLRAFRTHGAWRVDANRKDTGEAVRINCELEWEEWKAQNK